MKKIYLDINKDSGILQNFRITNKSFFGKRKTLFFTNLGRKGIEYLFPDLEKYFSAEEIKNSYLLEENEPNFLLKDTNGLGKKYIVVFSSKENIKKFEKYNFKVIGSGKHKVFGNEFCMRKENDF